MDRQYYVLLIIGILIFVMLFFNKKVNLIRLFISQFQVFKNDKTGKYSIWDIVSFLVIPIAVSVLFVFGMPYRVSSELAEVLTTVFSLVFSILFGFAAVIMERNASDNSKKRQVVNETFVSIVTATVLSLVATIVSIFITQIEDQGMISILSVVIFALSLMIIMLILMITKRTFVIYCDGE